jgi:hypothetical protein
MHTQTRSELLQAHRSWEADASSDINDLPSAYIPNVIRASVNEPSGSPLEAHRADGPLEEALRLTTGDRQNSYGHPLQDFTRTAELWTALLGLPPGTITPERVGMMMCLLKLSRQMNRRKRDNLVDAAGYINCINMVIESEEKENGK